MSIIKDDNNFVSNTYARFPIAIVKGKGAIGYDEDGKEYIDLGSGIYRPWKRNCGKCFRLF